MDFKNGKDMTKLAIYKYPLKNDGKLSLKIALK